MTSLALINNWREFERVAPFIVIGFLVWKASQWIRFCRIRKRETEENGQCLIYEKLINAEYTEDKIESVKICKMLLYDHKREVEKRFVWKNKKEIFEDSIFHVRSSAMELVDNQLALDGIFPRWQKRYEVKYVDFHNDEIERRKKMSFEWKLIKDKSWNELIQKTNWKF
jgi:hypothetical protein